MKIPASAAFAFIALSGAAAAQAPAGESGPAVRTGYAIVNWTDGFNRNEGRTSRWIAQPSIGAERFATEQECRELLVRMASAQPGSMFGCMFMAHVPNPGPKWSNPYASQMEPADGSNPYAKTRTTPVLPSEIR